MNGLGSDKKKILEICFFDYHQQPTSAVLNTQKQTVNMLLNLFTKQNQENVTFTF